MKKIRLAAIVFVGVMILTGLLQASVQAAPQVSGTIERGYRILPVEKTSGNIHFTVYRGDYIKFDLGPDLDNPVLKIPALDVEKTLGPDLETAPYFKMKTLGSVAFSLGPVSGDITVIGYQQSRYREVTAAEAAELIENIQPLVLDVRTPREYRQGHLKNAVLIPVQELQSRWMEIAPYKNQDILIYCATGNRSTVSSKILIDNGFKRIYNLRHGIAGWAAQKYPVVP